MTERPSIKDLEAMGFDPSKLRKTRWAVKGRLQEEPEEIDPNTIPLIRPDVAHTVAVNFGLPFSDRQDAPDFQQSAVASMFIRMNSMAYLDHARRVAQDEIGVYAPSLVNDGFLRQLNGWFKDSKHFPPDHAVLTSAFIGTSLLLQMLRLQLGPEYVDKLIRVNPKYGEPSSQVISAAEWLTSFNNAFPDINRSNPIDRLEMPRVPHEQVNIRDIIARAVLVVPEPAALEDGMSGLYRVLDRNWGKLKLR